MTAAGRELAQQVHGEVQAALVPATGRLDPKQRRALTALLELMLSYDPT